METKRSQPAPHEPERCTRVRLAEGSIASVEACGCGSLQLHLGAVTMRFTPDALSSLMTTLIEASAAYAARSAQLLQQGHAPTPSHHN